MSRGTSGVPVIIPCPTIVGGKWPFIKGKTVANKTPAGCSCVNNHPTKIAMIRTKMGKTFDQRTLKDVERNDIVQCEVLKLMNTNNVNYSEYIRYYDVIEE